MKYSKVTYKYRLQEDIVIFVDILSFIIDTEFIKLSVDGNLWILKDYCWDGPSGLTIDTKSSLRASLVHDALYQLLREGLLPLRFRKQADKLLKEIAIDDGMFVIRANTWEIAVNKFAEKYARQKNVEILTAP